MSDCPKCTLEPPSPTTLTDAQAAILDSVHNLLKLHAELTALSRSLLERFRCLVAAVHAEPVEDADYA